MNKIIPWIRESIILCLKFDLYALKKILKTLRSSPFESFIPEANNAVKEGPHRVNRRKISFISTVLKKKTYIVRGSDVIKKQKLIPNVKYIQLNIVISLLSFEKSSFNKINPFQYILIKK